MGTAFHRGSTHWFGTAFAIAALVATACAGPSISQTASPKGPGVPDFWVRPGYRVTLAVPDLPGARFMEFSDKGDLYVSRPAQGDILTFRLKNGKYEQVGTFAEGYPSVHGLCFKDGWLWFTQSGSIHRGKDTAGNGKADKLETIIPDGQLPSGGGHWWRSILVTDDSIYTSIGDAGNATDQTDTERQKIWRFAKDGTNKRLWASGLRNTEKLRLRPGTNEIWGVDHGSDWFGQPVGDREGMQPITDDIPPDEFNRYIDGGFYGHPFLVGNRIPRIEYQKRPDIVELAAKTIVPEWCFPAHVATDAFTFLTKGGFPADHLGDAFVACHGSWNRSKKVGYCVQRVLFDKETGHPYGALEVVRCLTPDSKVLARPVDCVQAPDSSVLFSCDATGRIYRIEWVGGGS